MKQSGALNVNLKRQADFYKFTFVAWENSLKLIPLSSSLNNLPDIFIMQGTFAVCPHCHLVVTTDRLLRPRGRWFWRGGGYNFKTSPFMRGKFFTCEKREGGQILWHRNSSLLNRFITETKNRKYCRGSCDSECRKFTFTFTFNFLSH